MGRVLCRIGVHRWVVKRNPEDATKYRECARCRKQDDIIKGAGGIGFA
jgi:hypothetical protein